MLPVPTEARIYLSIVAGYPAKTEDHTCKRNRSEEQESGDIICPQRSRRWMFKNRTETHNRPHQQNEDSWSPKNEGHEITPGAGWRYCLRRKGLARPRTERARIGAGSLFVEDRCSHDVRGSALVALIRIQLRYGCHPVVPDLATACDTGPSD